MRGLRDDDVTQVLTELDWSGSYGECWMNATLDLQEYFAGCDYTDTDNSQVHTFIYSLASITCFTRVFRQACNVFLKNQFYVWSSSMYQSV